MIWKQRRVANTSVSVPGWPEPCTDVLVLPSMLLEDAHEGRFRSQADGPLGLAAKELYDLYKSHCGCKPTTITLLDGTSMQSESWQPNEDLLIGKIYGQAFDPATRIAFARCVLEIGANPAEIISIGERVYSEYVEQQTTLMTAMARARERVDLIYKGFIELRLSEQAATSFREFVVLLTMRLGRVPHLSDPGSVLSISLSDLEAAVGHQVPRGKRRPEYVTKHYGTEYVTVVGLVQFGLSDLREWHFENEDNETLSEIYDCIVGFSYDLLTSSEEGRQVLSAGLARFLDGLQ